MSLSVGEMRGYCYLMSTPPPPSGFSTIFFKLHRCTEDVHLVWSIVVNLFFLSLFSTCTLCQSRIQCVFIYDRNSSDILETSQMFCIWS